MGQRHLNNNNNFNMNSMQQQSRSMMHLHSNKNQNPPKYATTPPPIQQSQTMPAQQQMASVQGTMSQRNIYQSQAQNMQQINLSTPNLMGHNKQNQNNLHSKPKPFTMQNNKK